MGFQLSTAFCAITVINLMGGTDTVRMTKKGLHDHAPL